MPDIGVGRIAIDEEPGNVLPAVVVPAHLENGLQRGAIHRLVRLADIDEVIHPVLSLNEFVNERESQQPNSVRRRRHFPLIHSIDLRPDKSDEAQHSQNGHSETHRGRLYGPPPSLQSKRVMTPVG